MDEREIPTVELALSELTNDQRALLAKLGAEVDYERDPMAEQRLAAAIWKAKSGEPAYNEVRIGVNLVIHSNEEADCG